MQSGGDQHRDDARGGEHQHQPRPRIGTGTEAVQHRDRPARVRKPMHEPPGGETDPMAQQAGHHQGDEQVDGDRAETKPERPVRRHERDHHVDPPDRRERVGDNRHHMNGEEHEHQQRNIAVHELDHETRPPGAAPAERRQDPQQHARGEKPESDDTRRARRHTTPPSHRRARGPGAPAPRRAYEPPERVWRCGGYVTGGVLHRPRGLHRRRRRRTVTGHGRRSRRRCGRHRCVHRRDAAAPRRRSRPLSEEERERGDERHPRASQPARGRRNPAHAVVTVGGSLRCHTPSFNRSAPAGGSAGVPTLRAAG